MFLIKIVETVETQSVRCIVSSMQKPFNGIHRKAFAVDTRLFKDLLKIV